MEIKGLLENRRQIQGEIKKYQRKLESAPLVEKEYNNLMRDYENARYKYNEIMNKLMEARVAQGMEESQRGERFTIIEPAQFPEKPHKPNRIAIIIIGFVLALGAGLGIGAIRESLDISVKTTDELMRLTGAPVLSVIPEIVTDRERWSGRIRRAAFMFAGMGAVAVALYLVHLYVMPLEILWVKIQKRMIMNL
jgi:hypothetical protein